MARKPRTSKKQPRFSYIKIYTTPEIIDAFAARAAEVNRSVSKHGEYLVKCDLAQSGMKPAA